MSLKTRRKIYGIHRNVIKVCNYIGSHGSCGSIRKKLRDRKDAKTADELSTRAQD